MKRYVFALFGLLSSVWSVCAQYADFSHHLTFHGEPGYSRISIHSPAVSVLGGLGFRAGLGYEYRYRDFILQTGVDIQQMSSVLEVEAFRHVMPLFDTSGRPFDGIFDFEYNRERQRFVGVTVPIMAGWALGDYQILAGAKFLLGFCNIVTASDVDYKARYSMIIGSDGNGLLTNMPNHGLTLVSQSMESDWTFSPVYQLSIEVGRTFKPFHRKGNARSEYFRNVKESEKPLKRPVFSNHFYRLSLFCDYGFGSMKGRVPQTDDIINITMFPNAYAPALQHTLYSADRFTTLFAGVKFTVLFRFTDRYSCRHCYE